MSSDGTSQAALIPRPATVEDAETLADQRVRMYVDADLAAETDLAPMRSNFAVWVRAKLAENSYAGWLIEDNGQPIAGAGLWVMEWPPHFLHAEPRRAYLLNFYVAPHMRHRGLASQLLALAVSEAQARGIKLVTLHASKFGRPIYERSGFVTSPEMMLDLNHRSV